MRDELASEGSLQHRSAEGGAPPLRPLDRGLQRVDRRELLLDPRHDPPLLVEQKARSNAAPRPTLTSLTRAGEERPCWSGTLR